MSNKEVIPAFEMLLDELERIIPDLNSQGKELLDQKQYAWRYPRLAHLCAV